MYYICIPSIKFGKDLVLLIFPISHFEKDSQFIFQLNLCLPHPFVIQQSLKLLVPSCKQLIAHGDFAEPTAGVAI